MNQRRIQAFRVIHQIDNIEHVYVVMSYDKDEAKLMVAEQNGFRQGMIYNPPTEPTHPWHPRRGSWSVKELTEDDGPFKLYEFDKITGEMKL